MVDVLIFTDVNTIGFGRYAGAYRVATELRNNGYSVQVIDFLLDLDQNEIEQILQSYISERTLFVGFSTTLLVRNKQEILRGDHLFEIDTARTIHRS